MASILRQIVAGPRARHAESDLDLCYVSSDIIATSGPSSTWPQRAYRNPLDKLVEFLDEQHGENWAIWEFRAEGTGYPDEEVYGRVRHYPWPDHHPPPFRLIPMIMASMRNWLHGGQLHDETPPPTHGQSSSHDRKPHQGRKPSIIKNDKKSRVVVVHCKAGKGRSGTISCSYLIAECGWRPEEALTRFTERRMRPKFGAGISIPSQLRTITYVDRWTRHGKRYVDRPIEIVEIHVWGLRNGVKVDVEGYSDGGRKIKVFHSFSKSERVIVEGDPPESSGVADMMFDLAGVPVARAVEGAPEQAPFAESTNLDDPNGEKARAREVELAAEQQKKKRETAAEAEAEANTASSRSFSTKGLLRGGRAATLIQRAKSTAAVTASSVFPTDTQQESAAAGSSKSQLTGYSDDDTYTDNGDGDGDGEVETEPGGMAVILKPKAPIRVPNSDINVSVERRNRSSSSLGLTMVTAVAHVWFNAFFEGNGPEQDGEADRSGVFSIEWDAMDGIKGSSRKGSKALDRIAVVWRRAAGRADVSSGTTESGRAAAEEEEETDAEVVLEPEEGKPVPQMEAADWKGGNEEDPERRKSLGLRAPDPASADISMASSVKSLEIGGEDMAEGKGVGAGVGVGVGAEAEVCDDTDSLAGVRVSGPSGEEKLEGVVVVDASGGVKEDEPSATSGSGNAGGGGMSGFGTEAADLLEHPDTASKTTKGGTTEFKEGA